MEKEVKKDKERLKMGEGKRGLTEVPLIGSSVNIPITQVAELFRCGSCQVAPIKPPVYMCRHGDLTCSSCYRKMGRDCYKCNEPISGRNLVLEEVVRSLPAKTCLALTDCSAPLRESRSDQSFQLTLQDPALLEKLERARVEAEREKSNTSLDSVQWRASARPVYCPYPCGRVVTCSGLFPHFEFHHPKVIMTSVREDQEIRVDIPCQEDMSEYGRCVVFFVVKLGREGGDDVRDNLTAADLLKITRSPSDMLRRACFVAFLSVGLIPIPMHGEESLLVVWATCLYEFSPVSYTIKVINEHCPSSISFQGPLASLMLPNTPIDVYRRGDCLIIPPALQKEMSFGQSIEVSLTFHSNLPTSITLPVLSITSTTPTEGKSLINL